MTVGRASRSSSDVSRETSHVTRQGSYRHTKRSSIVTRMPRPQKSETGAAVRVTLSLSPEHAAKLDRLAARYSTGRKPNRSATVERLLNRVEA